MIRVIIALILLSAVACNSIKRNVVKSTVQTTETKSGIMDSTASSKTITNANTTEQKNQTDYEVETSQEPFPTNADTSLEIVKIAKSLPKGSKIKVTHNKGIQTTQTNTNTIDTTAKHAAQQEIKQEEKKTVIKNIKTSRFPVLGVSIGLLVIGIIFLGYIFIKKYT